jgi:hypothetical protein
MPRFEDEYDYAYTQLRNPKHLASDTEEFLAHERAVAAAMDSTPEDDRPENPAAAHARGDARRMHYINTYGKGRPPKAPKP